MGTPEGFGRAPYIKFDYMRRSDLDNVLKIRYIQHRKKKRQRKVADEFRATRKSIRGFVTRKGGRNAR
jgi:hypothetical protein